MQEVLKTIRTNFNSLTDFLDELYLKINAPVAIFDSTGGLIASAITENYCKCFYKLHKDKSTGCSIISNWLITKLTKGLDVDLLCENNSRTTARLVTINNKKFFITIYQYILDSDRIEENNQNHENNQRKQMPAGLEWSPTVLSKKSTEEIFNFVFDMLSKNPALLEY